MANIFYQNETASLDFNMTWIESIIAEKHITDDDIEEITKRMNSSQTVSLGYSMNSKDLSSLSASIFMIVIGIAFTLLGILQFHKLRNIDVPKMVKIIRRAFYVVFLYIGILLIIPEVTIISTVYFPIKINSHTLTHLTILPLILLQIALLALKLKTICIYCFQIVMVIKPFLFRENKNFISGILFYTIITLWLMTYSLFGSWAIYIIYFTSSRCTVAIEHAELWKSSLMYLSIFSFLVSLLVCLAYQISFVKTHKLHAVNMNADRFKYIKTTLVLCVVELLYDVVIMGYYLTTKNKRSAYDTILGIKQLNRFHDTGILAELRVCKSDLTLNFLYEHGIDTVLIIQIVLAESIACVISLLI